MSIIRHSPETLHPTAGYAHVTVVTGRRLVFLAGQCPLDRSAALVGEGDIDAQVDQVAVNTLAALTAAGATPEDVVRTVTYVVSDDNAVLAAAWRRLQGSVIGPAFSSAATLLGVARLGYRGQLVELDVTATLL
ncbi:MAG TPA: RidA family protein [Micromonosporaceae bacterium]|nr:RidA family protein [Micromonosporaceae bacterium]